MFGDTIAAVASPPGASARAVIRVSGPRALAAVATLVRPVPPGRRGAYACTARVRQHDVPALCLVMPAPGSYTGEDVVELHLPGAPLLLQCVLAALEGAGTRAPSPGEFSRRAFEHGRLTLDQAEAVADLIAAEHQGAHRAALYALSGGLAAGVARARAHLEDARAVLEAGLDFTAEETGAVASSQWLGAVAAASALLRDLVTQLPDAGSGGALLLLGAANAGKSSLCNALAERDAVLVADAAGTTRDVVAVSIVGGVTLLDAPGDLDAPSEVDAAALRLRDRLGARAGAVLVVVDATAPALPAVPTGLPVAAVVGTKLDLVDAAASDACRLAAHRQPTLASAPFFATSARTGVGLSTLRAHLQGRVATGAPAPGAARWRLALTEAAAAAARALATGAADGPTDDPIADELVAADLAHALAALDDVHGRASPEALLDRIFARFCLGK